MRAATYTIAVVPGDQGPAECVVNYFGPGQGGTVDANVDAGARRCLARTASRRSPR